MPSVDCPVVAAEDGCLEYWGATSGTWANTRAASGGSWNKDGSANDPSYWLAQCDLNNGVFLAHTLSRGFLSFDLSSVPAGATVTDVVLHVKGYAVASASGGSLCLFSGTQDAALTTADWAAYGATELMTRQAFSGLNGAGWNDWTLNGAGVTAVQGWVDGAAHAQFCARPSQDVDNSAPSTGNRSGLAIRYGEYTTSGDRPYLTVTYTIPVISKSASESGTATDAGVSSGVPVAKSASESGAGTDASAGTAVVVKTLTTQTPLVYGPTSADGPVRYYTGLATTWASVRAQATGTDTYPTVSNQWCVYSDASVPLIGRGFLVFDTGDIPAGAVILSARLRLHGSGAVGAGSLCLVDSTQSAALSLATSDFSKAGVTELASRIAAGSWNVSGYNDFNLNAYGLGSIATTGYTRFALRASSDLDNASPASPEFFPIYWSESTSQDPILEVTYALAVNPSDSAAGTDGGTGGPIVTPVAATESGTGTDASATKAIIDPSAGTPGSWLTRTGYGAASLVRDGGTTFGCQYPFGVQLSNGDIRVYYSGNGITGGTLSKTSSDKGASWSTTEREDSWSLVTEVYDFDGTGLAQVRRGRSGRLHAAINARHLNGNGSIFPNQATGNGWVAQYVPYYAYSDDDGLTWSTPEAVPFTGYAAVAMDACELSDGSVVIAWYGNGPDPGPGPYSENVPYYDCKTSRRTPGGAWSVRGTMATYTGGPNAMGSYCVEPQIDVIHDGTTYGKLIGHFHTENLYPQNMFITTSTDGGATWSTPTQIAQGANRGGLCVTADGDVIFAYYDTTVGTGAWRYSRDQGVTWSSATSVISGTSQPSAGGTGGTVGVRWNTPFPIDSAGRSPNLGICWGSGYDDSHGSTFFRAFTAGAVAPTPGSGTDTATGTDSGSRSVSLGLALLSASDSGAGADSGVAFTFSGVNASDTGAGTEAADAPVIYSLATDSGVGTELSPFLTITVPPTVDRTLTALRPGSVMTLYQVSQWRGGLLVKRHAGQAPGVQEVTVNDYGEATFTGLVAGEYVAVCDSPWRRVFFQTGVL